MASQVDNGKAFEWAVGMALTEKGLTLSQSSASDKNESCYKAVSTKKQSLFIKNARLAISHILDKELVLSGSFEFLPDSRGEDGDVRDIVITSGAKIFGISCKTNHSAYKHSRLSDSVNFVEKWGLDSSGCSATYLSEANSIFGKLRAIKTASSGTALWREQPDIPNDYYWPILDAFEAEVKRVESPQMCARFIRYLIGSHDFYKVVSRAKSVEITGFNINKSLSIPPIKLPDKITGSRRNNGSQYARTITFNAGWEFNFRIHNASSKVEPSLKFDVTATSLPPKLYQHHITH
jgi:hypothetical protein